LSRKNGPPEENEPLPRHALTLRSLPIVWPKKPGDRVPPVRTQARSATILPNFVGLKFEIHNGKDYLQVTITEDMVGHKLGEFSPTRKPNIYNKK
jgi:ribosomal protein S19